MPEPRRHRDPASPARLSHGEAVYRQLRGELINGTIPSGSRLLEVEVAQRLAVSRTPVREALRRLESAGFVQRVGPNRLVATPAGVDDLGDIGLLRVELDGLAARLAVARATLRDWDYLRALVDRLADVDPEDADGLAAGHSELHRAVYVVGFGPRMALFVDNHVQPYIDVAVNVGSALPTPDSVHRSHLALLRALSSGDVERAVAAAREHAADGRRTARKTVQPADIL
jgi:DNA-binding GntR family transcriptional regulator